MVKRIGCRCRKALLRGSSGATLVEVLVAVLVLALVLAAVPPVLVLIVKSQFQWSEQRVAESLTRNTIEYVKVTDYMPGNETDPNPVYLNDEYKAELVPNPSYEILVDAQPINPETQEYLIDPETQEPLEPGVYDKGVQEITVTIEHVDRTVLVTKNYKIDRREVWRL